MPHRAPEMGAEEFMQRPTKISASHSSLTLHVSYICFISWVPHKDLFEPKALSLGKVENLLNPFPRGSERTLKLRKSI